MSKIRNTIIIGVIGLVLTFLGTILPYFTISVFGYGTSISLLGYWEGKIILVLLFASLLFICKDYIEKFLPQLFDSGFGSKIKDANPKFVLIPTILMAVFAIWLFFSIEIDMTYIKYGIGFWLLWIGIICLLVHSFIYKKPIAENNSYYQTELIEYELYEEKELEEYLEKGIRDEILLPVKKGRQVIYDMVKSGICIIYKFRSKEEEEVMQKLYDFKTGEGQKS